MLLGMLVLAGCDRPAEPGSGAETAATSPGQVAAQRDTRAGREKSVKCLACHGALGMSENQMWPNLAGQSVAYIAKQLRDYREGRRADPWMTQMAVPLSDDDIDDLAAYFSSLDGVGGEPGSTLVAAATCIACHSAQAVASNTLWPALTGQNEHYLAKQLQDFRAGRRTDPVMAPLAQVLSDVQVTALAEHFANQ
jgi:cytochrome c553